MAASNPFVKHRIIAHRGASFLAPENTLPSIRLAKELGAQWVEVDVKITADEQTVIMHDDELDRTTNGSGWVATRSLEYIRSLDANCSNNRVYDGVQVPTLRELIETVLELDLGLQLELKPTAGDDIETAEIALAELKALWPSNNDKLFVSSFSILSLDVARRLMPNTKRCYAVCVPPRDPAKILEQLDCQILHSSTFVLSDEQLTTLNNSGVEYGIATVNDKALAEKLLHSGTQTVLSDVPDLLESAALVSEAR